VALFGAPRPTFFYPEITGGVVPLTFFEPAVLVMPSELSVGGENLSANGTRERLHLRFETRVTLRLGALDPITQSILRTWWQGTGALGKQTALVLDRFTPAKVSAAAGAAGNVPVGTHWWVVTFVQGAVQFPCSPPEPADYVGLVISGSAKQVNLSNIMVGPTGTTARKIYRNADSTSNSYGVWKLVGTIADNTTTTFTDNVADGALGAAPPSLGSYETDNYNRLFTKAELVSLQYQPSRVMPTRTLYTVELVFRQGA